MKTNFKWSWALITAQPNQLSLFKPKHFRFCFEQLIEVLCLQTNTGFKCSSCLIFLITTACSHDILMLPRFKWLITSACSCQKPHIYMLLYFKSTYSAVHRLPTHIIKTILKCIASTVVHYIRMYVVCTGFSHYTFSGPGRDNPEQVDKEKSRHSHFLSFPIPFCREEWKSYFLDENKNAVGTILQGVDISHRARSNVKLCSTTIPNVPLSFY